MFTKSKYRKNLTISVIVILVIVLGYSFIPGKNEYPGLPEKVDFNYHIRPILSQNCYVCHGPDISSRKANLRLDTYEEATKKAGSGDRPIVPGKSHRSSILEHVKSDDPDFQMPPPSTKKILTPTEIALLEKWIDQGAKWDDHWAFIPPKAVNNKTEVVSHQIDQYIEKAISDIGLETSDKASNKVLIRRVSYTLTGLPPTIEEIERFETLLSDGGYVELVDYYLRSKHFGEHWARHWMDLVRYAERMGHEFDFPIGGAHHYRDYLIRAFNEDLPYDQFVKEHLAGDLLKDPRINEENINESVIGTAYAFLGEGKHSPVDIKQEEADRIDNIIDVTSKTFLGLTVSCAKCHDHKFDPIPTKDYYAMYGMFESSRIGPIPLRTYDINSTELAELSETNKLIEERIEQLMVESLNMLSDEDKEEINQFLAAQEVKEVDPSKVNLIGNFKSNDKTDFAGWINTGISFGNQPKAFISLISENSKKLQRVDKGIATSRFYGKGIQGSLRSLNFEIQDSFIIVKAAGNNSTIRIIVDNFQLIQNPLYGMLEQRVENEDWDLYIFNVSMLKGHKAYVEILPGTYNGHEYSIEKADYIDIEYVATSPNSNFYLKNSRNHSEYHFLNGLISLNGGIEVENDLLEHVNKQRHLSEAFYDSIFIMGLNEGSSVYSPVFERGSIKQQTEEKVEHRFLTAVNKNKNPFTQEGSGRLEWANEIVNKENPLTSRVMVNRIWHYLFGRGIVESVDNFGLQGMLPSHPDLLDFLAVEFQKDWSIKRLIKNILLSETFQRSTNKSKDNLNKDPENIYLSHYPIRRIEAESIRDAILKTSGELNPDLYGPPVPIHLTEFMNGRGRPKVSGPLDGNGRRSIYIEIRRNFLSPMMLAFDYPIPFSTFGKRNTTNVPGQSLTLMNSPFVHDQARKWAGHIIQKADMTTEERIGYIYKLAYSREAGSAEIKEGKKVIQEISMDLGIPFEMNPNNLEVWTSYCHSIFNTKEFIYLI